MHRLLEVRICYRAHIQYVHVIPLLFADTYILLYSNWIQRVGSRRVATRGSSDQKSREVIQFSDVST